VIASPIAFHFELLLWLREDSSYAAAYYASRTRISAVRCDGVAV
jgi:hypothetical protein